MKKLNYSLAILLALIVSVSCEKETILPGTGTTDVLFGEDVRKAASGNENPFKITGTVELVWKGASKGSNMGNKPEELLTFMEITAIGGTGDKNTRGELVYTVLETDLSMHREIKADVLGLAVNPDLLQGWIVGVVVSDSKGCDGGGHAGHDDSCGGHTDDPSGHDGGCSHDDTDDGGCSHDDTDEGGCSHDDTDEGGCSGSGGGPDIHGGSPGGAGSGNPLSGKNCRTGQIIAMKVKDLGTPGANGDHITWKWFDPNAYFVPDIDNISDWPHLCRKEIIEGNIVIHLP